MIPGDWMDAETRVREHFAESIATKQDSVEPLSRPIVRGGQILSQSLLDDGKISDATYTALEQTLKEPEIIMEICAAVGCWGMVSKLALSTNLELEDGIESWPPNGQAPA